jgi:predicted transcriptional regulator
MDRETMQVFDRISSWPQEDREELAEVAAAIEARRAGIYVLTDEERAAVDDGLRDADDGNFVLEDEMKKFWARFERQ